MYDKAVKYIKKTINNVFLLTPEISKNIFLALEHGIFFTTGIYLFYDKPWFHDLNMIWEKDVELVSYIYYYFYFVRYLVQLKNLDKKEKDYNVTAIHHLMTLGLLGVSFFRYMRIGLIIAVNHDLSDIFLNMGKAFNKIYEKNKNYYCSLFSDSCILIFITTWVKTRIIVNFNILEYLFNSKFVSIPHFFNELYIDEIIALILLIINFILQLYWQILIIVFAYNVFLGKKAKDEKGITYTIKKE